MTHLRDMPLALARKMTPSELVLALALTFSIVRVDRDAVLRTSCRPDP